MRIEFPLTLAAVQAGEKAQWKIGDALREEIPPSSSGKTDASGKKFAICAQMLASQGYNYSAHTLTKLRDVADSFPAGRRRLAVPFTVHRDARTPDNLDAVIEALEKARKPITRDNVRMVMKAWRDKAEEQREKRKTAATKKRKDAATRKRRAQTEAERQQAERDEQEALNEEMQLAKSPPPGDVEGDMPDKSELEVRALCLEFEANADAISKQLAASLAKLKDVEDRLDADMVEGIIRYSTKIISAAESIIKRLDKKRRRFEVHQGGAA